MTSSRLLSLSLISISSSFPLLLRPVLRRCSLSLPPRLSFHSHRPHPHRCSSSDSLSISATIDHSWREFSTFVNWVSSSAFFTAPLDVHLFAFAHRLHPHFLRVANASLAFARHHPTLLWSLPREDIEVVVANASPYLFTNASAAAARMNFFLSHAVYDLPESDKPSTADLMEFLLSYAYMAVEKSEDVQIISRVESSVCKLFSELANYKGSSMESVATVQKQFSDNDAQAPRSFGESIEMKKGDWTCPRCSFMNFAKNSQCLQCDEHRPQKFLLGGEWECPQCSFCNFGRNVICLRCDCKRPAVNLFLSRTSESCWRADTTSTKGDANKINSGFKEEQQWFTEIAELEKTSNTSSILAYEDLRETMKAGDDGLVTSIKNSGIVHNSVQSDADISNLNISQSFDDLTRQKTSYMSDIGDLGGASSALSYTASEYQQHKEPMFWLANDAPAQQQMSNGKYSSQLEDNDNERALLQNSERWLNENTLPNAELDDDFPEIKPMRKGENHFVVSKKKDRSGSSPMYKRRVAMEQAGKNNYVPFVPFPPGHFSKDKSQVGFESRQTNEQIGGNGLDFERVRERKEDESYISASNDRNRNPKSFGSQFNSTKDYSKTQSTSKNASVKDSGKEKSLEGSAVKEPDPLDMSEEAKAERWFQRVAQIKDISELSQIPEEDFPSIMPMRKGVNRFVVSKRKTPLERRLMSSQYRRNLPVEGTDTAREETNSD